MPNPWSVVRYNKTVIVFNGLQTSELLTLRKTTPVRLTILIEGNNCLMCSGVFVML